MLLIFMLVGLTLTLIDRQRRAVGFDINNFLDGYKHTKTIDTTKTDYKLSTRAFNLEKSDSQNKFTAQKSPALIQINDADIGQIQMLPGIGPVLAQKIIAFRDSAGSFTNEDDLLKVSGIGTKKLEKIIEYIEF